MSCHWFVQNALRFPSLQVHSTYMPTSRSCILASFALHGILKVSYQLGYLDSVCTSKEMDGRSVGFEYLETMATIRSDSVHAVKHQYKYQIHLKVHDGSFNAHEKCKNKKPLSRDV